jgi:predicted amidohydrolase
MTQSVNNSPSRPFRIAVAQAIGSENPDAPNIRANGIQVRDLMQQAHNQGARLIQFHEGALSGYPSKHLMSSLGPNQLGESDWTKVAWDTLKEELEAIQALARRLKLWTVLGSVHPLTPPHRPHNSLYVISDEGKLATRYDKRLISNTEILYMYTPGQEPIVFEVDGLRFGCVICIEINYPELFMEYERLGVDCVLFSTYSKDPMFGIEAQGHAASNSYWITFSPPAQGSHAVPAGVIAPNGSWITQGPTDGRPAIVIADLDPSLPEAKESIQYRRPWRRTARSDIYEKRHVTDSRSQDKTIS